MLRPFRAFLSVCLTAMAGAPTNAAAAEFATARSLAGIRAHHAVEGRSAPAAPAKSGASHAGPNYQAGIAALRRLVADHRADPLATAAQARIGDYCRDSGRYDQALEEYLRCRRLPGCADYTRARRQAEEVASRLWRRTLALGPTPAPPSDHATRLLSALRELPADSPARPGRELEAVLEALAVVKQGGWTPYGATLVGDTVAACRGRNLRAALAAVWLHGLAEQASGGYGPRIPGPGMDRAEAVVHSVHSPALDAHAILAAWRGGRYDTGTVAARLLPLLPYVRDPAQDVSPAYRYFRDLLGEQTGYYLPKAAPDPVGSGLAERLLSDLLAAGRFDEMLRWAAAFGVAADGASPLYALRMYARYPEYDRKPLVLFVNAEAWTPESAATLIDMARRFPAAPLTELALERAVSLPVSADRRLEALGMLAELFPENRHARLYAARNALEAGDTARARELRRLAEALAWRGEERNTELLNLAYEVDAQFAFRDRLAAVLKAPGTEVDRLKLPATDDVDKVCEAALRQLPERRPEVMAAAAASYACSYRLWRAFLDEYPDRPEADAAWSAVRKDPDRPDPVWLAPFINRGPAYRSAAVARQEFEHAMPADPDEEQSPTPDAMLQQAREMRERWPGSRAACLAELLAGRALLANSRPEEARPRLAAAIAGLPADDPGLPLARLLARRAEIEMAAKRMPDWRPVVAAAVDVPQDGAARPGESHSRLAVALAEDNTPLGRLRALAARGVPVQQVMRDGVVATHGRVAYINPAFHPGLVAVDMETGAQLAWYPIVGVDWRHPVTMDAGRIYLTMQSGKVQAFARLTVPERTAGGCRPLGAANRAD